MRYILLTLATLSVLGCGGTEPISQESSPLGCWRSDTGELDLMGDGSWRQTFDASSTTDAGSWTYSPASRKLMLSIDNASSANASGAQSLWRVERLTSADMLTKVGAAVTQWRAIGCQ